MSAHGEQRGEAGSRVLAVDDEIALLMAYANLLRAAGCDVTTADDGEQAMELVQKRSFDVILSDIHMPRMDGFALLKAARELDRNLPVVLMTGTPSEETTAQAERYGAFRCLTKPCDPLELRQVVNEAAALGRARRGSVRA
jgi:CheY-like chemotaxis protein